MKSNIKTACLLSICFLLLNCSYAQSGNHVNKLEVSVGAAIPVGNFASIRQTNDKAGYAKPGENLHLSFLHSIHRNISLVATVYAQRNSLNTSKLEKQLDGSLFFFPSDGIYNYSSWTVQKTAWWLEAALAGIQEEAVCARNKKISFYAREVVGAAHTQMPGLNATNISDTSYTTIKQNSAFAFALSYALTAGIQYRLSKCAGILFSAGYFGNTPFNFKNVTETINSTNGGLNIPGVYVLGNSRLPPMENRTTVNIKQPVVTLHINLGLAIAL